MKDFSTTLIRCSALGSIMGSGSNKYVESNRKELEELKAKLFIKGELTAKQSVRMKELEGKLSAADCELSKTAKGFLIRTYAVERYYREKDVTTKPMLKGTMVEEEAITLFCRMEKVFYEKNKQRIGNDFICGTPDLYTGDKIDNADEVIDIKSSWDIYTFLSNIGKEINAQYYWQLQGYMALTNAKTATLAYCLVNTPDVFIEDEKKRLFYKMNVATEENPEYKKAAEYIELSMKFDDIPLEEKVLRFTVDRNDDDIEKIYKKVDKCREFLQEFQETHLFFTKHHRKSQFRSQKIEEEVGNAED